jgi:hypothetical protein
VHVPAYGTSDFRVTPAFIEGEYFTELDWHGLAGVQAGRSVRLIVPIIVIGEFDDLK